MGSGSLTLTTAIAANAVIATIQLFDIATSPEVATEQTFTIPSGQTWIIDDLYILVTTDAGTSNPEIRFVKNQVLTLGQTNPIGAYLVSNSSRPKLSPALGFEGQTQMQIYAITSVLNNATVDDILIYGNVDKRL